MIKAETRRLVSNLSRWHLSLVVVKGQEQLPVQWCRLCASRMWMLVKNTHIDSLTADGPATYIPPRQRKERNTTISFMVYMIQSIHCDSATASLRYDWFTTRMRDVLWFRNLVESESRTGFWIYRQIGAISGYPDHGHSFARQAHCSQPVWLAMLKSDYTYSVLCSNKCIPKQA